jgi:hypothetical protein
MRNYLSSYKKCTFELVLNSGDEVTSPSIPSFLGIKEPEFRHNRSDTAAIERRGM